MYRLVIRKRAVDDTKDAWAWYENRRPGLGDEFLQEINHCYDRLEQRP